MAEAGRDSLTPRQTLASKLLAPRQTTGGFNKPDSTSKSWCVGASKSKDLRQLVNKPTARASFQAAGNASLKGNDPFQRKQPEKESTNLRKHIVKSNAQITLNTSADLKADGSICVIAGPNGVGKSTFIKKLMADCPGKYGFSVSHTTRAPRPDERDGIDYHFVTREKMEDEISSGQFLEYAENHRELYGTSIKAVEAVRSRGQICLLDIDVQGVEQIKRSALAKATFYVFLIPPSLDALEARLRMRNTESEEKILSRLKDAQRQLHYLEKGDFFDLVVTNDELERSYATFKKFLDESFKQTHGFTETRSKHKAGAYEAPSPGQPSSLETRASASEVAMICKERSGKVLTRQSILKCDHFPSSRNLTLSEQLKGAPNFRKAEGLPVYGCAQPTVPGCSEVLETVRANRRKTAPAAAMLYSEDEDNVLEENPDRILWINCREAPVLYINGRPYCVKDRDDPFGNLVQPGIEPEQLLEAERQLKNEVMLEAERNGGRILLHGEKMPYSGEVAAWGEIYAYWEPVHEVLCVHEVYGQMQRRFPELRFKRLPITDEHAPSDKIFDILMDWLKNAKPTWCLVCNCQMGRSRTTTAMVLLSLLWPYIEQKTSELNLKQLRPTTGDQHLELITELTSILPSGVEAKSWVDDVIRRCSHVQELKAHMIRKKQALSARSKDSDVAIVAHMIQSHILAILFAAYLLAQNGKQIPGFATTFQSWMQRKQKEFQIYDILGMTYAVVDCRESQ